MGFFTGLLCLAAFLYLTGAQDVVCSRKTSKTVQVEVGESFSFKTQAGRKYRPNTKCVVRYKKSPTCSSLRFSCSKFSVKNKKSSCPKKGDRIVVVADGKAKRFCQRNPPNITTSEDLKVVFLSNKGGQSSGAECLVQCQEATATTDPVRGCPKETPKFNTACHPSEEGLTCPYGRQTCCGEISPEAVMECRQEMWVGYAVDTVCMLGGPCPGNETTPPASCICPEMYTPVCGSDGKTYSNTCFAKCKGVGLACSGECPCNDCVCPAVYDPVCGSDGKTYSNTCSAGCKGVGIACSGECPCADCICPAVFAPVCGSDGRTYSNECQAVCAGAKTACSGECPCTLS